MKLSLDGTAACRKIMGWHLECDASYKGLMMALQPLRNTSHYLCRASGKLRPEWAHLISQLIMETDSICSLHMGKVKKIEGMRKERLERPRER